MFYIQDQPSLNKILKKIESAPRIAIDTEADSLHHYYEKLCLFQLSTPDEDYVIDPLAGFKLDDMIHAMRGKEIICHGADFDIRMLKKTFGFLPNTLFDTVIAAQFLNYPKPSYASLVEKHFQVKLQKANQKADWSFRPLTESMLEYAKNDVHYLHSMRAILTQELKDKGRLEWFLENCKNLIKSIADHKEEEDPDVWRIKGSSVLNERELVVLKEIWGFREVESQRRDRPRFKVLSAEGLIKIARWLVTHHDRNPLDASGLPDWVKTQKREEYLEAVQKGFSMPLDSIKRERKREFPYYQGQAGDKKVIEAMKTERRKLAEYLDIDPSLLVSNFVLEQILKLRPPTLGDLKKAHLLSHWQFDVVGEHIFRAMSTPTNDPS